MSVDRTLLASLLRENPFQPATSFWRSVELAVVIRHGLPEGRGLDLGCGDGRLMRILLDASKASPGLVGIDIDPLETHEAMQTGAYAHVHTASGARIPEPDDAFDFVFSNSVLEHIDDLESVIADASRVLKPGGTFLFTVPSDGFHGCLAGPLVRWRDRDHYLADIDQRCAHKRYWGQPEWGACLGRHGVRLSHVTEYLSVPEVRRWETLSRFTAGVLFLLFGKRRSPIQIQRSLGLRRAGFLLPAGIASALAGVISAGVRQDASGRFACLLVEGRKSGPKGNPR